MASEETLQRAFGEPDEWALAQGYRLVAGLDEVGRGAMAGPVVAGAVILETGTTLELVDDSKALRADQREDACEEIRRKAVAWSIGVVEPEMVDRLNVWGATCLAMRRALDALRIQPQFVLIDGLQPRGIEHPHRCFVGGDGCSPRIGAASIVAKVMRDRIMERLALIHPGYDLQTNKGYVTPGHKAALRRLGPSPLHRHRYRPVDEMRSNHLPFSPEEMERLTRTGDRE